MLHGPRTRAPRRVGVGVRLTWEASPFGYDRCAPRAFHSHVVQSDRRCRVRLFESEWEIVK